MGVVVGLALAQLRHHLWRWLLLSAGVALVVALPVVAAGLEETTAARSVHHTVAALGPVGGAIAVDENATGRASTTTRDDVTVRAQLARLSTRPALRTMEYRQLTERGQTFFLGAADHLSGRVALTSGRLPTACSPTQCEAVIVSTAGVDRDSAALRQGLADLGVVVVGTARRTDPLLIGGPDDPGAVPLVLGNGVDAMGQLAALSGFARHVDWTTSADANRVVALGVSGFLRRASDVEARLATKVGETTLTTPDDALQAASTRATTSTRRFGLIGGLSATLLLGFAFVGAVGLRRETQLLVSVLRRRGALPRQVAAVLVLTVLLVAVLAAVAGSALGAGAAALTGQGLGPSLGPGHVAVVAVAHARWSILALAAAAALVAAAVFLWPEPREAAGWRLLDLLAVCALGGAVLTASRGATSLNAADPLVWALPALCAFVTGVVAARLWEPAADLAERLLPRRAVAGRIGLLGAARRPLRVLATVGLVAAAVAAVVFAGGYRATLRAGAADQAAYQVPLDVVLAAGPGEPAPARVVEPTVVDAAVPGVHTYGVLRTSVTVSPVPGTVQSVPAIGVAASAVAGLARWSRTTGSPLSAARVAALLRTSVPATPTVPPGPLTLTQQGVDQDLAVNLYLRASDGRSYGVALTPHGTTLTGTVPDAGVPLHVAAVSVAESAYHAARREHAIGEGSTDVRPLAGTLRLGGVLDWSGWGAGGSPVSAAAGGLTLRYRIEGSAVVLSPDPAGAAVPVAVDAATAAAAHDGILALGVGGGSQILGRVAAVLPRLPTEAGRFLLADRGALAAALDRQTPGLNISEFWLDVPAADTRGLDALLSRPVYAGLTVTRRAAVARELGTDPVATGSALLLALVAFLALAAGAVALVLLVVGERRDGAGELFAWEADGVAPRTLRRMLAVRETAVAILAVPVGCLGGFALTWAGAALVAVDAWGTRPVPPLQVAASPAWAAAVVLGGTGAALVAGAGVAALMLREPLPVPPEADLR